MLASSLQLKTGDTPIIFDWLMGILSYQGISDAVADGFMARHGNITWAQIEGALSADRDCRKLDGYWAFTDCRYQKGSQTCAEPDHFRTCPLPRHDLRNGRLNQTGYSLFLFIRDIAGGDLVRWIDQQVAPHLTAATSRPRGHRWSTRSDRSTAFLTKSSRWRWRHC